MKKLTAHNAGVEAAAEVMNDLDRSGWFASAIRARATREAPTDDDILDAMVDAAAGFFSVDPEPDDLDAPEVRRCMAAILARLRADGVVN